MIPKNSIFLENRSVTDLDVYLSNQNLLSKIIASGCYVRINFFNCESLLPTLHETRVLGRQGNT